MQPFAVSYTGTSGSTPLDLTNTKQVFELQTIVISQSSNTSTPIQVTFDGIGPVEVHIRNITNFAVPFLTRVSKIEIGGTVGEIRLTFLGHLLDVGDIGVLHNKRG